MTNESTDAPGRVGVDGDSLAAVLLYSEFTESIFAASWMEPTEALLEGFEQWIPDAVESRLGSDYVAEQVPALREILVRAQVVSEERAQAVTACEFLAGLPETHWTEDVRLEGDESFGGDEYGYEDRVRFLLDHDGRLLGVQIVDYVDGRYCYLDTFVGTVNRPVKDGVVSRKVDSDLCDRIDRYHKEKSLWTLG